MGILQLLSKIGVTSTANPSEEWLKARYPDLFRNGERLPPMPTGTPPYAPPTEELPPVASNSSMPSPTQSTGGVTGAPVGGAQDGPVAAQPAPRKHGGILGALKSVLMPDAGSFMYSALNNPNGLWGASGAQETYQQNQTATEIANEAARAELAKKQRSGEYQVVGNSVFHMKPDGTTEMIGAPPQPTETQRLIDQWRATPPGPEKDLIERAIKGYQYTPEVIGAQGRARAASGVAVANARGAQARKTKATPSAGGGITLPAGAKVIG